MPIVSCPMCSTVATLPDPWTAPGYTCPHCHAAVAIAAPMFPHVPPPAPVPEPFDLSDEPTRPRGVHYRNRTTATDAAATGFGDAFGRMLGGFAATLLVMLFVASVVVIVGFAIYYGNR